MLQQMHFGGNKLSYARSLGLFMRNNTLIPKYGGRLRRRSSEKQK